MLNVFKGRDKDYWESEVIKETRISKELMGYCDSGMGHYQWFNLQFRNENY